MKMDQAGLAQDPQRLRKILSYHVVVGQKLVPDNFTEGQVIYTDHEDQRLRVVAVDPVVTLSRGAGGQDAKVKDYIDNGNVSMSLNANSSFDRDRLHATCSCALVNMQTSLCCEPM
jgi:uncharacterized surface protein with fasciclin (FAS1) repeats